MRHLWVRGARWNGEREVPALVLPPIDADRWAGPYSMAAALLGHLVPEARAELVAEHDIEIRAAAPALCGMVPARRRTVSAYLPRSERILVPAPRRTLRLANGITEFVREHLAETCAVPVSVIVENVQEADYTDLELLGVMLRRIDPALLTVVVCAPAAEPPLAEALPLHVDVIAGRRPSPTRRNGSPEGDGELVGRYFAEGFHHAAAEIGRGALLKAEPDSEEWWQLIHRTAGSLAATGCEDAARDLFDQARRESADPVNRATAAYATAMLLVRHHDPERRDAEEALAWINEAIAITSLLPDRRQRAFHLGFDLNGKALVESRRGRPKEALELVEQAIELADAELEPGEHPIHRMVLRVNRSHLRAQLGDLEGALADLDAVISTDPGYPDYYIDRGNLLHRLGRPEEAVADYERAMRVGPPFPEPYYNRAEVRFATGDHRGALEDLDYAIELDPDFVDAYANRAGLLVATGEYGRALADARHGLARSPGNAYLLCALGQAEAAMARYGEARRAFDAALYHDPLLVAAWASRGALAYERGDPSAAVGDLTWAIELADDAALRFNRAMALRALGREDEARADLARALELDPEDEDVRQAL